MDSVSVAIPIDVFPLADDGQHGIDAVGLILHAAVPLGYGPSGIQGREKAASSTASGGPKLESNEINQNIGTHWGTGSYGLEQGIAAKQHERILRVARRLRLTITTL